MLLQRGSTPRHALPACCELDNSLVLQTAPSSTSFALAMASAASSAVERMHPQLQAPAGCTVGSSGLSHHGIQAISAGYSGVLPLGTIIVPANDSLPPGSLVLSRGTLPGGHLRLALPSQLPLQLHPQLCCSQPLSQLHTAATTAAQALAARPLAAAATQSDGRGPLSADLQSSMQAQQHVYEYARGNERWLAEQAGGNRAHHDSMDSSQGVGQESHGVSRGAGEQKSDGVSGGPSEGASMLGEPNLEYAVCVTNPKLSRAFAGGQGRLRSHNRATRKMCVCVSNRSKHPVENWTARKMSFDTNAMPT